MKPQELGPVVDLSPADKARVKVLSTEIEERLQEIARIGARALGTPDEVAINPCFIPEKHPHRSMEHVRLMPPGVERYAILWCPAPATHGCGYLDYEAGVCRGCGPT